MEQHPVPQNVTTFQFRLIGDMTIKQFGYLAGGAILAYIMYKLPLPFFFTWPLAVLSAVGGIGLAFVPIEERPMDVWVLSFIKSIYSPTQYIWSKHAQAPQTPASQPAASTRKGDILNNIFLPSQSGTVLSSVPQATPPTAPARHMDFSPPPVVKPEKDVDGAIADTQQKELDLEDKVKNLQTALEEKSGAQSRAAQLQTQLAELLAEREKMAQELDALRNQGKAPAAEPTGAVTESVPPSTTTTTTQTPAVPTIQIIAPGRATTVGLPRLTTFANVVTGIVKDKEKNLLPGVIVTVKDKDGVPLRALKTNRLGQFAASTQLPNGTYFVEIEDPRFRFTFDRAQITLNGSIVPALEIFAKTEKEITRAKLEKELFGKPNT
jgi:hypothetical protein